MDIQTLLILTGGVLLGCFIGLSWFAGTDAPYVPTKMVRIKKVLMASGLKKGQVFYELGSGDGRVVIEAAKIGARAYGIEQSWIRVLLSRWKVKSLYGHPGGVYAKFIHGNIFNTFRHRHNEQDFESLENADIVFIFLLPKGVQKLEPLLKKHLKKGSRVITQTFHFKNWQPYKKLVVSDKNNPNTKLSRDGKLEGDFWLYRT